MQAAAPTKSLPCRPSVSRGIPRKAPRHGWRQNAFLEMAWCSLGGGEEACPVKCGRLPAQAGRDRAVVSASLRPSPCGSRPFGLPSTDVKEKNQPPRDRGCWCRPSANVRSHTTPPFASVPALRTGFKGQRVASGKLSLGEWGSSAFVCSSSSADPHSPSFASPPVPVDLQEPRARLAATGEGGSVCDRTQAPLCGWPTRREGGTKRSPAFSCCR